MKNPPYQEEIIARYKKADISMEVAAEKCHLNIKDFLALLARLKIDVFQVDFDDLSEEITRTISE